ncbi:MAG: carbohydrate ABC transporter permease [Lachnospiraceae bacterium]|nr:carbohydrate ABC transporter permease [Lachnospiraceae bacterium]
MKKYIKTFCLGIIVLLILFPVLFTFINSFMSPEEVKTTYEGVFGKFGSAVQLQWIPQQFSMLGYEKVFIDTPNYLIKFWRSLGMCSIIVVGQIIVGSMCGLVFAKYRIGGKRIFFILFIIFLLLPVQVTLVPNYIILSALHLTDTWWALVLPAIFSPFSTFFMTIVFQNIPMSLLEAGRLDGANTFQILTKIVLPVAKPGVISLAVLVFVDNWNMVEQPMVFLNKVTEFPLSVFLASVNAENFELQFVCGILSLIPVTLLFLFFHDELAEGISVSVSK